MKLSVAAFVVSLMVIQVSRIKALHSPFGMIRHGFGCNGTTLDILQLAFYRVPSSQTGKLMNKILSGKVCMLACLLKDLGVLNAKGDYNKDGTISYLKKYWTGAGFTEIQIYDIMEKCCEFSVPKTYTTCDLAYEISYCFSKKLTPIAVFNDVVYTTKQTAVVAKDTVVDAVTYVPRKVEEGIASVKQGVTGRIDAVKESINKTVSSVKTQITDSISAAQKKVYDEAHMAKQALLDGVSSAQERAQLTYQLAKDKAATAIDEVKMYLLGPIFPPNKNSVSDIFPTSSHNFAGIPIPRAR